MPEPKVKTDTIRNELHELMEYWARKWSANGATWRQLREAIIPADDEADAIIDNADPGAQEDIERHADCEHANIANNGVAYQCTECGCEMHVLPNVASFPSALRPDLVGKHVRIINGVYEYGQVGVYGEDHGCAYVDFPDGDRLGVDPDDVQPL